MRSKLHLLICLLAASVLVATPLRAQETQEPLTHLVEPGDTWTALALRYATSREALQAANPHPNPYRQPAIGATITLPPESVPRTGALHRPEGSLLRVALATNQNVATLARLNGVVNPYRPLYSRALFVPREEAVPRDLPPGLLTLELSRVPAQPGHAVAYRATTTQPLSVTATLDNWALPSFGKGTHLVGVGGTGAFFYPGAPELAIRVEGQPLWSQPWRFQPGAWDYDQLTLTGAAAQIDQAAIIAEGERLAAIWAQWTPIPQWTGAFQVPVSSYLEVSSRYGARRSYNGGPYRTYHEGVDFSAYRGTPVYATAAGTVVLAEMLYVRGGAVIVDHGLGIFSGYYHMSAVHATPGQRVQAGEQVGEVGTEGLSTGNHLHWDLLAAGTWIDAAAWEEQDFGCWLLAGWGTPCP